MRPLSSRTGVAVAALGLSAVLSGQDSGFEERSGYGTDDLQVVTLLHPAFVPHNSSTTYFSLCCSNIADSYRHPTAGPAAFVAPLHPGLIPNGARVVRIDVFVRDSTALEDADIDVSFCRSWVGLDGLFGGADCPGSVGTSGAPGDTVLTTEPDHTVRYGMDADGDGDEDAIAYTVLATFGSGAPHYTNALRLRMVRILYRRQVALPPSSATFADVPVPHPFFQFIEALAASGITAGCGDAIYCPDAPVTRGQMAVFLAKALGLHWPAP